MSLLDRIFRKKKSDESNNAKAFESATSDNTYNIKIEIDILPPSEEHFIFALTGATAEVLPKGLKIALDADYVRNLNGLGKAMQFGLFQKISSDDSLQPFVIEYNAMESVNGKLFTKEVKENITETHLLNTISNPYHETIPEDQFFRIEILYSNNTKKTRLLLSIRAVSPTNKEEDTNATLSLYNNILANK